MNITKEDFERAISLAYQRGRIKQIGYIEQYEINECISDAYRLIGRMGGSRPSKPPHNHNTSTNQIPVNSRPIEAYGKVWPYG